jgi:16S rRNA (cytosine1407-C5)-methyltransferase
MSREQPDAIGCIRSNDIDPKRLTILGTNLNRSGLAHIAISKINGASFGVVFPETFDSILLDAPCSGEGTGYKSASAYERWSEKGVKDIADLQQSLLHSAAKACKIG